LAVPNPFAENMILRVLRESKGRAIAIQDSAMIDALKEVARLEGLLMAPEGGALWEALLELVEQGHIQREERILILNTGSGYKYLENIC